MKKIIYLIVFASIFWSHIAKAEDKIVHVLFNNIKINIGESENTFTIEGIEHNFSSIELIKFIEFSLKRYNSQDSNPPCIFSIIINYPKRNLTDTEADTYNKIDDIIRYDSKSAYNAQVIHLDDERYPAIECYWNEYKNTYKSETNKNWLNIPKPDNQ